MEGLAGVSLAKHCEVFDLDNNYTTKVQFFDLTIWILEHHANVYYN